MVDDNRIYLIDGHDERRIEAERWLIQCGLKTTALSSVDELNPLLFGQGILFVSDDPGQLSSLVELLNAHRQRAPILCYSQDPAPQRVVEAVFEGADDYLTFPFKQSDLEASLRKNYVLLDEIKNMRLKALRSAAHLDVLTDREKQVLSLVALGCTNHDIGEVLSISPRTVEIHRARSRRKIGAKNTADVVKLFVRAGLIS